jgi:CHAD domain-containing protein
MRETELKLLVAGRLDVAALAAGAGAVHSVEERGSKTLTATYYDTDDLRLARWGATLRYRTGEGAAGKWTLKLPDPDGDPSSRLELDFASGPRTIPGEAPALTRAYVRAGTLKPVAKLRTRRRSWALVDGEGELAELVDDQVALLDGRAVTDRFREVEIEARAATAAQLKDIAAALEDGGAAVPDQVPKAVRALGPRAQAPPDVPAPDDVAPRDPAAAAVEAALRDGTRRVIGHHAGVVLGDVEGVHQMRVGARRLRSDLRTFASLVDAEWAGSVRDELKWLAGALGEVRDLDVLTARLRGHAGGMEEHAGGMEEHAGAMEELGPLFERLEAERDERREALLGALDSDRYVSLLDTLVAGAADPPVTEAASEPCAKVLPPLVAAAWGPLGKAGRLLDSGDPEDEWHRVRIKAKRARYAAEAAGRCLGSARKEARAFASACAAVQDVLGEHQDAIVAREVVTGTAAEIEATPAFYFAAGRLAETEERAAQEAREAFPKTWEDLDRKKRRRWFSS